VKTLIVKSGERFSGNNTSRNGTERPRRLVLAVRAPPGFYALILVHADGLTLETRLLPYPSRKNPFQTETRR
jgi:hypothetical protein